MLVISAVLWAGLVIAEDNVTVKKAVVSYLKGIAKITKKGTKEASVLKLGFALNEGDRIDTGEASRLELKLEDGSIIRVSENSSIVIEVMKENKEEKVESSTVNIFLGRVWMNVKKGIGKKQESRIVTPKVTAAVKGTSYRVDVNKNGETSVSVYDGTVAVGKDSKEVMLTKLETLSSKDLTKNPFDERDDEKDEWVRWNKSRDKLRVMIVVTETADGVKSSLPISETSMIELFLNNYLFSVVDQAQLKEIRESEKLKAALKGDAAAAAAAGLEFGADMAIICEAKTRSISVMDTMYSGLADMNGKVVRTDTADVITARLSDQRQPDIAPETANTKALNLAAKKLGNVLIEDIVKKWKDETKKGAAFNISVTNVNFEKLNKLQNVLATIQGAKNPDKLYFVANRALLSMQFVGDSASLSEKIAVLDFKDFKVDVVGMTAYKIELEIKQP
jgi:hypothetical protein